MNGFEKFQEFCKGVMLGAVTLYLVMVTVVLGHNFLVWLMQ